MRWIAVCADMVSVTTHEMVTLDLHVSATDHRVHLTPLRRISSNEKPVKKCSHTGQDAEQWHVHVCAYNHRHLFGRLQSRLLDEKSHADAQCLHPGWRLAEIHAAVLSIAYISKPLHTSDWSLSREPWHRRQHLLGSGGAEGVLLHRSRAEHAA